MEAAQEGSKKKTKVWWQKLKDGSKKMQKQDRVQSDNLGMGDLANDHSEGSKKQKKVKPGSFQGLGLSQVTYKAIMKMGYKVPTPIQRRTIPTILEGQDVVAMARTGSGKTAAFLIPIVERLKNHSVSVGFRAVVLSPTRELAIQTAKFCRQLGRYAGLRCCLLVGGQAMEAQFEHLANNPDVVIATPGRLMHHIMEAELSLSRVEVLVFDEADRLFELGFAEQLQKILDATPISRQCLLFSATLPAQLVSFSRAGIKNPAFIRLDVETTLSESLDLWFLYVRKAEKLAAAISVLRRLSKDKKSTIMFVATRHHVEFFGELLNTIGVSAAIVYGSMDQIARQEQVAKFRGRKASVLVTTDVAARGIDIPLLDYVLNFDFPPSAKLFVHRSGRTARAGRSGLCISLVTLEDLPYTVELSTFLGLKLKVADDKPGDAEEEGKGKAVVGSVPPLDLEVEGLEALLLDEGTLLKSLYKSMMASYNLYYKTRPSASKSSVARAKQMVEEVGGPAQLQGIIHPAFREEEGERLLPGSVARSEKSFIQELRTFRPRAEKVGNVISTGALKTMEQAKLDASAVASVRTGALTVTAPMPVAEDAYPPSQQEGGSSSSSSRRKRRREEKAEATPKKGFPQAKPRASSTGPRVSKRARLRLEKGGGSAPGQKMDFSGWDVKVDGLAPGAPGETKQSKRTREADFGEQFFLSVERDKLDEAKERGLDMEQYQMDLLPDDSSDIKRSKSVMRWDAKKKKYLPVMVSVDGRVVKGQRRNESGQKVKGEGGKSGIYQKWTKASKRRIQKVGELEQATPLGKLSTSKGRAVEFGDTGDVSGFVNEDGGQEAAKIRKPIVPFHGDIDPKFMTHKQKRLMKKRSQQDRVIQGKAKSELKTPQQIQKDKKKQERNKLKQKPGLRKEKAKQAKEARKKMHADRQMKYGARTKAKMLVIEGDNKWKKKARTQKGYGSRSSF